jgi:hypothetical protein
VCDLSFNDTARKTLAGTNKCLHTQLARTKQNKHDDKATNAVPEAAEKVVAKTLPAPKDTSVGQPKTNPGGPRVDFERSRCQFQCRTGQPGPNQNFAIKYGIKASGVPQEHGTEDAARKAANAWLVDYKERLRLAVEAAGAEGGV